MRKEKGTVNGVRERAADESEVKRKGGECGEREETAMRVKSDVKQCKKNTEIGPEEKDE